MIVLGLHLATRHHLEIDREFLRESDVGTPHSQHLIEPALVAGDRFFEALPQHEDGALAQTEEEVVLVLEIDVHEGA